MRTNKNIVYQIFNDNLHQKFSTADIAEQTQLQRTNVSSLLNALVKEEKLAKTSTRPVYYFFNHSADTIKQDAFGQLIGAGESLKQIITETLSHLLYPKEFFHIVIDGNSGVGKTTFAKAIGAFYLDNEFVPQEKLYYLSIREQLIVGEEPLEERFFSTDYSENIFSLYADGLVIIDEFYLLSEPMQKKLFKTMHQGKYQDIKTKETHSITTKLILVDLRIEGMSAYPSDALQYIELPPLENRSLSERFAFIQKFFIEESSYLHQSIQTNAETLRSLLLYEVPENLQQLQHDIKKGCAHAYVKSFKKKERILKVYLGDFKNDVRKGFALYLTKREQVENIIPSNFNYIFSPNQVERVVEFQEEQDENIYHFLDSQFAKVQKQGLDEHEFVSFLSTEVENTFASYGENDGRDVNKQQLSKIVDVTVIELVEQFLLDAEKLLGLTYDASLFNGLCLHIDALREHRRQPAVLHPSFVDEIQKMHPDAYRLSQQFIAKLNETLTLQLPDSEIIILASLISHHNQAKNATSEPAILVAMHGDETASSIATVVKSLSKKENVFAFNLSLTDSYEHEFDRLQTLLKKIDQGAGVLVIYDMGSIASMCEVISDIEHLTLEYIQAPITLIGIEAARRASEVSSVSELKENIMSEMTEFLTTTVQAKKEVVVSLCSTGEGAAMKVKEMIDELNLFGKREVISLSYMQPDFLTQLAEIERTQKIYCIVATHNPYYRDVKFIPMTKILEKYLHEKDMQVAFIEPDDLETIFAYLGEQLDKVSVSKVRKHIPQFIQKIINEKDIDTDQSIGLMLHIVSHIERLLKDNVDVENLHKETIIKEHFALYTFLKKELRPIERAFKIIFSDDALANIIAIIEKL